MKVSRDINIGCFDFTEKPKDEPTTIIPPPPVGDDDPYDDGKRDVDG